MTTPDTAPNSPPAPPSDWVVQHCPSKPDKRGSNTALDVAAGNGRHSRYLQAQGWRVTAIDRNIDGLTDLRANAEIINADLEATSWPLPGRQFDLVVVANYLHRPLFGSLRDAVRPGGTLIYETFMQGNEAFGRPRSPEFLLAPDELRDIFADWHILAFEQGEFANNAGQGLKVIQRICVKKPS